MNCRIVDMRNKEVISIKDGCRLGVVCDVEVDTVTAKLTAIVVLGRLKCFGFLGREEDIVIPWCNIDVIGTDTILVSHKYSPRKRNRFVRGLCRFFGIN